MTTPAHIAAGYIISAGQSPFFTAFVLTGSVLPDIDAFFGSNMNNHRNTPFHAPVIWLALLGGLYFNGYVFHLELWKQVSSALLLGVFSHMLLDWYSARTCGIRLFYPFSRQAYSLFPTKREEGAIPVFPTRRHATAYTSFWTYYISNPLLFGSEIIIITVGLIFFVL